MADDVTEDLAAAQLAELSQRLLTLSETTERLAVGITNHILFAGTIILPTAGSDTAYTGFYPFAWGATCGAVEITNPGSNEVMVTSTGPGNATYQGAGVHLVQPGTFRIINVDSRVITIYGTAEDKIGVQAMTIGGFAGQGPAV